MLRELLIGGGALVGFALLFKMYRTYEDWVSDLDLKEVRQFNSCFNKIKPETLLLESQSPVFDDYKNQVLTSESGASYLLSYYDKPNEIIEQRKASLEARKISEDNETVQAINHCVLTVQPSFHVAVYNLQEMRATFFIAPDVIPQTENQLQL